MIDHFAPAVENEYFEVFIGDEEREEAEVPVGEFTVSFDNAGGTESVRSGYAWCTVFDEQGFIRTRTAEDVDELHAVESSLKSGVGLSIFVKFDSIAQPVVTDEVRSCI